MYEHCVHTATAMCKLQRLAEMYIVGCRYRVTLLEYIAYKHDEVHKLAHVHKALYKHRNTCTACVYMHTLHMQRDPVCA
jgi:hypothetical protein